MDKPMFVTGKCHKCGRVRNVTGSPAACVVCIRSYQRNLNRRALKQAKRNGKIVEAAAPVDSSANVQAMFEEALREQLAKVDAGTFEVVAAAEKDEV
jgi:hypothetical protein